MKALYLCLLTLFLFSIVDIKAQKCASMSHLEAQLQADSGLAARRAQIEQQAQQFAITYNGTGSRAVITIPVIVHVLYNTTAQNISTAQIQSQIDILNEDFRKLNSDWTSTPAVWQSLVADYEIEFCLATRDPNGNATTGIIRKQTSVTSFSTNDNIKRNANGGDDAWPSSSYLNLWVGNLSGGTLGYAQFPGGAAATDGVVINYDAFGNIGTASAPYNLGRTATHEVGHWLNLYHIWGDDGSACTGSDNVSDTPNQGAAHYGCPNFPSVSCSNGTNGSMFMNYMDYTDDACMYMFTNGQKTRSLSLFGTGGSRAALLNSLGCQSIASPPTANFSANGTSSCTGVIKFNDLSTNSPSSWSWNFGDGTTSNAQSPTHTYTANGTYTVTLTATNQFGSNSKTLTNYITINKPSAPIAVDQSRCGAGSFSLTTASSNNIAWLDSSGSVVSTANTFVTPVLNQTTTYWLQDTIPGTLYHVGQVTNSGSGGYLNSNWAMVFNVTSACTLQSVYVYANGAGNRTFQLRNSTGAVLSSLTVNVPTGGSRVTLNFPLTPGSAYQLGFATGTTINLYRNNAGAVYPYTDAGGHVSITGNNATNAAAYYYYVYDWIIQGTACVSEQNAVTAEVSNGLSTSVSSISASCGSSDGSATVIVNSGTPSYTFQWSTGGNTASITNLSSGIYTVTVTDANQCSGIATANVAGQSDLVTTKTSGNVSCFGGSNGYASVNIISGTPSFSFVWSNSSTTASSGNLSAGNYFVTITDGNNCVKIDSFTISEPAALTSQTSATDVSCNGLQNGGAAVAASGGSSGYSYIWSNGQNTNSLTGLSSGSYSVTVSDNNQCSISSTVLVSQPDAINLSTTTNNLSCYGSTDGSANVVVSGGVGTFTYNWCNGSTTHNVSGLSSGNCNVTVTDDNGCSATTTVSVVEPSQIQISVVGSAATAAVDSVGGGTAPYSYSWSNGSTNPIITGMPAGTYTVTVADANGCSATASAVVLETGIGNNQSSELFSIYPNPTSGLIILDLNITNEKASVEFFDMMGRLILLQTLRHGKNNLDITDFPSGTYSMQVRLDETYSQRAKVIKQ